MVSLLLASAALVQTALGPTFNPLSPLHRAAYSVTGVEKTPAPPPQEVDPGERQLGRAPPSTRARRRRRIGGSAAGGASSKDHVASAVPGETAVAAAAAVGVGGGGSVQRSRHRNSTSTSSSIDARRGSSSRRGRGRGSRGSLAGGVALGGGRTRGRAAVGTAAARGPLAEGAARAWGPGGVGARGVGRALVWTVVTAGVIATSR